MLTALLAYTVLIASGLALFGACLVLTRRLPAAGASIAIFIAAFVLIRDAMTPAGLWTLGIARGSASPPTPASCSHWRRPRSA